MAAGLTTIPITPGNGATQGVLGWDTGSTVGGVEGIASLCMDYPPPAAQSSLCWNNSASLGAATHATVKGGAGNVAAIKVANRSGSTLYLWLFAGTSTGASQVEQFMIPAGATVVFGDDWFGHNGMFVATGITWGMSTTSAPTAYAEYGTPTNIDVSVRYV